MRTKLLKFGMPLMAFLLAIVFAFATNHNVKAEEELVTGYIFSNNTCNVIPNDCTVQGTKICKIGAETVYRTKTGTLCSNPLMRF